MTYDPRKLGTALKKAKFDNFPSVMYPYLNATNNLFYLMSKGQKVAHTFYHDVKTGEITKVHEMTSKA